MTRDLFSSLLIFLAFSASGYAQELIGIWPRAGGPITIQTIAGPIQAGGLDIKATGPYLSNGSNPAPWAFYITGNDKTDVSQVTLGSLGPAPTIDGSLTLDISVSGEAPCFDGVSGNWGSGTVPVAFPISACLPEPSGATLAVFPLLFLFGLRKRRR